MAKIKIDRSKCIGCGACVAVCPDSFEMEDGRAVIKKEAGKNACAREATDSCPVQAISIQ